MLFRNGENLKEGVLAYLNGKTDITIFTPYIKHKTLKELLASPGLNCSQIIARWEPNDFAAGSSDLEVYELCKENSIALYMNERIHLKLYTDSFNDAFLGSANISERAITSSSSSLYNYETCTYVESINRADRIYLQNIINESILITDDIIQQIREQIPETTDQTKEYFDLSYSSRNKSDFLISKLPMSDSPELLWELYSQNKKVTSKQEENCLCHDISLYQMNNSDLKRDEWMNNLAENFFKSPFIVAFLKEVDNSVEEVRGENREGLRFGAVRKWFSNNTTSVPSPRPFELTENVQILYRWIEYLSKGQYIVTIPGAHSQVLVKVPSLN